MADFADGMTMEAAAAMLAGGDAPAPEEAPPDNNSPGGDTEGDSDPEGDDEPQGKKIAGNAMARARVALRKRREALEARERSLVEREATAQATESVSAKRLADVEEAFRLRDYDRVATLMGRESWLELQREVAERESGKDPDARRAAKRAEEERAKLERERTRLESEKLAAERQAQLRGYHATVAAELAAIQHVPRGMVDASFVSAVVQEQIAALKGGKKLTTADASREIVKRARAFVTRQIEAWESLPESVRDELDTELGITKVSARAPKAPAPSSPAAPKSPPRRPPVAAPPSGGATKLTPAEERAAWARANAHLLRP